MKGWQFCLIFGMLLSIDKSTSIESWRKTYGDGAMFHSINIITGLIIAFFWVCGLILVHKDK